jgi:uncharacterized protein YkwD
VTRSTWNCFWRLGMLCAVLGAAAPTWADPLSAVEVLREGGCGGVMPAARPLRHNPLLDRIAAEWALGRSLPVASAESGFRGDMTAGVRVSGPDSATLQQLRQVGCRIVVGREMRDIGLYRRGLDSWLVVASIYRLPPGMVASSAGWAPSAPAVVPRPPAAATSAPAMTARVMPVAPSTARTVPAPADDWDSPAVTMAAPAPAARAVAPKPTASLAASSMLTNRALELINKVRSKGTHCGDELFGPAPPVHLSGTLDNVALGHASDMAEKNYFEHVDPAGHSPADRVRAVGYQEKLVGENIAYGPESVDEVVKGWLDSPGHCENIMDPRFAEMGIALAPGRAKHGLYWVQVLAEPRA